MGAMVTAASLADSLALPPSFSHTVTVEPGPASGAGTTE